MQYRSNAKLSPKYFGPFQILDIIGKVVYKLNLPASAQIHHTVHVSQLKQFKGTLPQLPYIPDWLQGSNTEHLKIPEKILARTMVKRHNRAAVQFLVQWQGFTADQATWEFADSFTAKYPHFQP